MHVDMQYPLSPRPSNLLPDRSCHCDVSTLAIFDLPLSGAHLAIIHMFTLSSWSQHPGVVVASWRSFPHVGLCF